MKKNRHRSFHRLYLSALLALMLLLNSNLTYTTATAASVNPTYESGNPDCEVSFKIDETSGPFNGTYLVFDGSTTPGQTGAPAGTAAYGTITITNSTSSHFDWAASGNLKVKAVIVKAGNGANIFSYSTEGSDTSLYSPINPKNSKHYDISHVTFCFEPLTEEPDDPSPSPTPSEDPSPSPTPSDDPSPSPTPSEDPSPSPTPSDDPSPSPTPSDDPSPSPTPSDEPSPTPSEDPSPSPTPSDDPSPSPTPSDDPSPTPSDEPSPTPSEDPSPSPTPSDDPSPSPSPSSDPTPASSPTPSSPPNPSPSPEIEDLTGEITPEGAPLAEELTLETTLAEDTVSVTRDTDDLLLDEPIPEAAPMLPQTGGIPLEAFMGTGVALLAGGLSFKKKRRKTHS